MCLADAERLGVSFPRQLLTITLCCCEGSGTCMRRAPPMAGCGTSPSPPISLEVSTMTTRF